MIENIILTNLLYNEKYTRKVLPFIKKSYFQDETSKLIFTEYVKYYIKYNTAPSKISLAHAFYNSDKFSDITIEAVGEKLDELEQDEIPDENWLVDSTEDFCQERAIFNAIQKSINIIDGEDEKLSKHAIPELLRDALSVTFDTHIGHDYFEDAESRFRYYSIDHPRIPFDLEIFNKITNGGCPRKTLNAILAGVNVGKSMILVHIAAAYMMLGYNVLYVTMEMAEEEISNRVDANLMQVNINDVTKLTESDFNNKIQKLQKKTTGKLIVKEYPTASAHTGHIRQTLQELKMKKRFVPDVILVDYIGIMASERVKLGNTNSYGYLKSIAEELRGLAVESNVVMWTAVQVNRDGYNNTDFDMTNTADAWSIPAALDFFIGVIRTEELDALGQLLIKQLKSRYGDKNYFNKFCIGVDVPKMYLFDVDDDTQIDTPKKEDVKNNLDKFADFKIS
jgi:replicative DNA helicase